MRSDYVTALIRAHHAGDEAKFESLVTCMVATARQQKQEGLATQLEAAHSKRSTKPVVNKLRGVPGVSDPSGLLDERDPRLTLESLILSQNVKSACEELIEEQQRADVLRAKNLEPRHRVLLSGPPGNGKTSLAEALAGELKIPFLTVAYEALIGKFLGETGARLHQMFESVKDKPCVLFFDEFDAIGKERGDVHETGEIKRVVSTLLLQMDKLPSHVVAVCATNHGELLDRAVWRRFQLRLDMPAPTLAQKHVWLAQLFARFGEDRYKYKIIPQEIAASLPATSYSDLKEFSDHILRRLALAPADARLDRIVGEAMHQWQRRVKAPVAEERIES